MLLIAAGTILRSMAPNDQGGGLDFFIGLLTGAGVTVIVGSFLLGRGAVSRMVKDGDPSS